MQSMKAQLVDQEILKFKVFIDKFYKLFQEGYLSANMMESQHNEIQRIANELKKKNDEAEAQLNKTVDANELLKEEGRKMAEKNKVEIQVLWAKAHSKFKEFESILDSADKKRAKESLKELEAIGV